MISAAHDTADFGVRGNTPVLTRDGWTPIPDVYPGAEVLTADGTWVVVQAVHESHLPKTVVNVEADGLPFLAATADQPVACNTALEPDCHRPDLTWALARSVSGDTPIPLPPMSNTQITLNECWLVGRWLANGVVRPGPVGVDRELVITAASRTDVSLIASKAASIDAIARVDGRAVRIIAPTLTDLLPTGVNADDDKTLSADLLGLTAHASRRIVDGYHSAERPPGHVGPALRLTLITLQARSSTGPFTARQMSATKNGRGGTLVWVPVHRTRENSTAFEPMFRLTVRAEEPVAIAVGGFLVAATATTFGLPDPATDTTMDGWVLVSG